MRIPWPWKTRRTPTPEEEYIAKLNADARERQLHPPTLPSKYGTIYIPPEWDYTKIKSNSITADKIIAGSLSGMLQLPTAEPTGRHEGDIWLDHKYNKKYRWTNGAWKEYTDG